MIRARLGLFALLGLGLLGCSGRDEGVVEIYWQFEDARLQRVFPLGARANTCGLTDRNGIEFDIVVQLTINHYTDVCAADPSDPSCAVVEPKRFDCARARGTVLGVPPSSEDATATDDDPGYLMIVEPLISTADGEVFVPLSTCIARPGPRVRRVRAGRISDLEVHEFIIHALDPKAVPGMRSVDLETCRSGVGVDTGTDSGSDSTSESGTGTDTGSTT